MPKQAGGLSALIDGPVVPNCAACGAAGPDPAGNGYCQECGSTFGDRLERRFKSLRGVAVAGAALFVGGGVAALWLRDPTYSWCGAAVLILGAVVLGWTALRLRRTWQGLQAAARMRSGKELVYYWTKADRRSLITAAYFVAVLAALMPYVWFVHAPRYIRASTEAAFEGRLPEYAALDKGPHVKVDNKVVGQARRAFKIVVIDVETDSPRISPIHFLLPPEMRAATPDEVGTIALMRYEKVPGANYVPGNQPAFEIDGELTLINLANKTVLYRDKFRGGPPPREVPSSGVGYGSRPSQSVAGYLKSLPSE